MESVCLCLGVCVCVCIRLFECEQAIANQNSNINKPVQQRVLPLAKCMHNHQRSPPEE